jgi:hypothetical protein
MHLQSHGASRLATCEELKVCSLHQGWHWRVNYTCQWPHYWPCLRSDGKECIAYLWHSYEVISVGSIKAYGLKRAASMLTMALGGGEWSASCLQPPPYTERKKLWYPGWVTPAESLYTLEKRKPFLLLGIAPQFCGLPLSSSVTLPGTLHQLPWVDVFSQKFGRESAA